MTRIGRCSGEQELVPRTAVREGLGDGRLVVLPLARGLGDRSVGDPERVPDVGRWEVAPDELHGVERRLAELALHRPPAYPASEALERRLVVLQ